MKTKPTVKKAGASQNRGKNVFDGREVVGYEDTGTGIKFITKTPSAAADKTAPNLSHVNIKKAAPAADPDAIAWLKEKKQQIAKKAAFDVCSNFGRYGYIPDGKQERETADIIKSAIENDQ